MLDIVRNNKKITQIFLALITLPFALWGVDSFRNTQGGKDIATVGNAKISVQEFEQALRDKIPDPSVGNVPAVRKMILDALILQKTLVFVAEKDLDSSDDRLNKVLRERFSENGTFSAEKFQAFLVTQRMSEAELKRRILVEELLAPVLQSINSNDGTNQWIRAQLEQREVSEAPLLPENYLGQVKLAADAVQKYYEANRKNFELPEQVRAEFLVLSRDAMTAAAAIGDEEARNYYTSHADRYKEGDTRRASHILIRVDKGAPEAAVAAAKAKADQLLAQVRKTPGDFAKIAKDNSQDPGSAAKGGDLDWFSRGAMVKAFEDVAFTLKEGQVSDVVRSDFGFHIIRVTGVRPERVKPFEEVKAEILSELKREAGMKKYADAAEAFGNVVYEQADSLKPAAEKWKLDLRQSQWLAKGGKLAAPFDNQKLAAALFSDDGLKNKRNTEAVEVAPGTLVSARVLEHKPAALQPLEAVRGEIEKRLMREEAAALAIKDGEGKLARLAKGEAVELKWSPAHKISRNEAPGLPPESLRAVFVADATKLPAHAGVAYPGKGYALYRISSAKAGDADKNDPRARELAQQYARIVAEEEFAAWLASLKESYPVKINKALLESKDR